MPTQIFWFGSHFHILQKHKEMSAVWTVILSKKLGGKACHSPEVAAGWAYLRTGEETRGMESGEKKLFGKKCGQEAGTKSGQTQGVIARILTQFRAWYEGPGGFKQGSNVLWFFKSSFCLLSGEQVAGRAWELVTSRRWQQPSRLRRWWLGYYQWVIIKVIRCHPVLNRVSLDHN